jgi:alkyldihydroxyacetonephosphate synthase
MSVVDRLRDALGDAVRTDDAALDAVRSDTWVRSIVAELAGRAAPQPAAVVEPASTAEAAVVARLCREAGVPVIPVGGGSGVVGGVLARPDAVMLSTAALTGIVEVHEEDLLAVVRAGTNGWELEQELQARGLTTGHWPQSIRLSTVGGWVATRASGQFSTAYGSVEDLVLALEAVLPDGRVLRTRRTPRAASGPDLRHLLLGSEGTLGLVTEVTFSLRPLPERRLAQAFSFASFRAGLEAIRRSMAVGHRPPVVRLYDGVEADRHFGAYAPDGHAFLVLVHEGPRGVVEAEVALVADLCRAAGGRTADAAAAEGWLAHRSEPPSARPFLERGVAVDTLEVAATWSVVGDLYDDLLAAVGALPGVVSVSAHSSHSYRSGTNLYLTFAAAPDDGDLAAAYDACWAESMRVTVRHGAGISHHHGIGRVRRPWLAAELGDTGVALLRALKRALDPDDLWNPGVLLPPS